MTESIKESLYNIAYDNLFVNGGSIALIGKRACVEVLSGMTELDPDGNRVAYPCWRVYTQLRLTDGKYCQPSNLKEFRDRNEAVNYLSEIVKASIPKD